ncbi:response regulator [Geomonas sp. Red875]|uniref:histidine kinase n=2 Tax=Geomesophilobacter sediminis TaxID=2798584 RepID=A0A8J7M3H8_9BACT|nr:response regulator [Geomesophilobacter sediminis]
MLVVLETSGVPFFDSQGRFCGYRGMDQDITHHKQAETRRDLSNHVLQLLNDSRDLKVSIEQVIDLLKTRINLDAVGVRLKEGDDYPYVAQSGFPPDLLMPENTLVKRGPQGEVCRDSDGGVCLECTCGMVITGKIPKDTPLFTAGGSFWTNDALALLRLPVDQNLRDTARNRCIRHGYASIALVPLRYKEKIVGLIHCMDHRKDRLSLELIECLEGIAAYLGAALTRKWYEEERINLEKQLQQAQRLESVGRLAGGVAHDFNNMLVVIIGHASLGLLETGPDHPSYKHLQAINTAAERSADLTRQLLAFARKQTIEPQVIDLNDTISRMLKMLQRLIGEEVELSFEPGATCWPVRMDPSQIDQIMANLCVNARDAIVGAGKITIETGALVVDAAYRIRHPEAGLGEYVWVSVRDNGCGMDRQTLSHIFEPFFTTKAVGTGTGLGLATIYGIVKQNSGFINVDSAPGKGSTFTIGIPKHTGTEAGASAPEPAVGVPGGHETILLVEDEPAILQITAEAVRSWGYRVLLASSPGEAIRLAHEQKEGIDLLVTDVILPEMNGKDLALCLQSAGADLKCLFMSGYTADVIAPHGVLDQRSHFIQKPFSLPALALKIREVLDQVPTQLILPESSR